MMKTGIDVVEISRISGMPRLAAFVKRVFTKEEAAYFEKKGQNRFESIAGHFAAKEAFSKYMGSGMRGFSWKDITVCHDEMDKPYLKFMGHRIAADLSISHSKTVAVAVVCGEEDALGGANAEQIKAYCALMPKRFDTMHKGDCGSVLIVAGSKGMTGAAALCATAALRCGSGLVTVGTPKSEQPILAVKLTEAMTLPLPDRDGVLSPAFLPVVLKKLEKSDVCALGPGLRGGTLAEHRYTACDKEEDGFGCRWSKCAGRAYKYIGRAARRRGAYAASGRDGASLRRVRFGDCEGARDDCGGFCKALSGYAAAKGKEYGDCIAQRGDPSESDRKQRHGDRRHG